MVALSRLVRRERIQKLKRAGVVVPVLDVEVPGAALVRVRRRVEN